MTIDRRRFIALTGIATLSALGCGSAETRATDASTPDSPDAPDDVLRGDAPPAVDARPDVATDVPPADVLDDANDASDDAKTSVDASDGFDDAPFDAPDAALEDVRDASADAVSDAESLADPSALIETPMAFPLQIMAGDMLPDGAVLWTRYVGREPLTLRVYEMDGARYARLALERRVTPNADGYSHTTVDGLRAFTVHRYVFVRIDDGREIGRSVIGRFRTAPDPDAAPSLTFAGTSCTHQRRRPFPTMSHVGARSDVDFFVHLGDMTYCDGARSVADYRARYAENWATAGFRALLSSTGLYQTWDDHEVDNNWSPETTAATTIANARQAFFEHRAMRRDPTTPDRIWRSFRHGRTAEIFILDCRGERRPSTRTSRDAQYLSREQMDWLKTGLMRSTAVFKIVLNSVPITNFPLFFDFAPADRWEGYAAQRNEVLDFITAQRIEGVWWLSGDFHLGAVGRVEPSGPRATMREVIIGPGGNNPNLLFGTLVAPQFDFATGDSTYTLFRAEPSGAMSVTYVNEAGREVFSRRY